MVRAGILLMIVCVGPATDSAEPLLRPGDRVALIGGTLIERLQYCGVLESELHCRRPDWKLTVRNLGWSGDDVHSHARKAFGEAGKGRKRLLNDLAIADPTVTLICYGSAEAANGNEAVAAFESGLFELTRQLIERGLRVILVRPIAMPGYAAAKYPQAVAQCRTSVDTVASDLGVAVIGPDWMPAADETVPSGLVPNERGYRRWSTELADALVGSTACDRSRRQMKALITSKNQTFFHRYRPQNETYLYLFRRAEQGNNAVEVPQFEPLVDRLDRQIWAAASQ